MFFCSDDKKILIYRFVEHRHNQVNSYFEGVNAMDILNSFYAPKRFFDKVNFPYGFTRSGDFTKSQAQILETCGNTLQGLEQGQLQPENEEQKVFVEVCQGYRMAESAVEKAWMCYRTGLQSKGKIMPLNRYHEPTVDFNYQHAGE